MSVSSFRTSPATSAVWTGSVMVAMDTDGYRRLWTEGFPQHLMQRDFMQAYAPGTPGHFYAKLCSGEALAL